MHDWDPANAPGLLAGVGPYRMALAAAANGKRQWSVHNTDAIGVLGIDNNAIIENILNVQNASCSTMAPMSTPKGVTAPSVLVCSIGPGRSIRSA